MKERRRCWQRRRRFLFLKCYGAIPGGSAAVGIRGSEMMLSESMNQGQAWHAMIAARKPRRTKVSRTQEGCMQSEPLQVWCARLAVHQQSWRAFAIPINRSHLHATWPSTGTSRRVLAMRSLSTLRRGILAVLGPHAPLGSDHYTLWAKGRPYGAQRKITQRHRQAIYGVPEARRHDVEGGQAHVLAVPSSAHSQAPPISHMDDADRQDQDSQTAM